MFQDVLYVYFVFLSERLIDIGSKPAIRLASSNDRVVKQLKFVDKEGMDGCYFGKVAFLIKI
ncbi:MAG: hypothetical protein AAFN10_06995 [Bacteroidota bacterium]